jgi:hypothetical protein
MKRAFFLAFLGVLLLTVPFAFAQNGSTSKGNIDPAVDLSGKWKSDKGEVVTIMQYHDGRITATFENGDCKGGGHRLNYIDGELSGYTLKGEMTRCTLSKALSEDCPYGETFTTPFYTSLVSHDLINGMYRRQHFKNRESTDPKDEKNPKCLYIRDESEDKDIPFTMSRMSAECPDVEAIKKYEGITNRSATFIKTAAHFVTNQAITDKLEASQSALRETGNQLSRLAKQGQKCQEIHDALDEIYKFQAAIDQINHAGCDSQALAGGFDNLFQAAGSIGQRFIKIPELQSLFELLASDPNFFQKVTGALNPEHRWANQFGSIDGYIPNCVNH